MHPECYIFIGFCSLDPMLNCVGQEKSNQNSAAEMASKKTLIF